MWWLGNQNSSCLQREWQLHEAVLSADQEHETPRVMENYHFITLL